MKPKKTFLQDWNQNVDVHCYTAVQCYIGGATQHRNKKKKNRKRKTKECEKKKRLSQFTEDVITN